MSVWEHRVWLLLWPIGAAIVVVGDLGWWIHGIEPDETYVLDVAVGATSIAAGLIAWSQRPGNRCGPLLVLAGFLWALGGIRGFQHPVTAGIGDWLDGAQDLVFAHLLIAYPTGRLASPWLRGVVVAGYGLLAVSLLKVMTIETTSVGTDNALALWNAPALHDWLEGTGDVVAATYAVTGIGVISWRWVTASPAGRHVYGPVLGAALLFVLTVIFENVIAGVTGSEPRWAYLPSVVARIMIPVAFLYGLLRGRIERSGVGDLVIEAGRAPAAETMQVALARALHDPSLELAQWAPERGVFVDAASQEIELPPGDGPRVATLVERDGQHLAAIIHDRALLEDPRLVETVSATAGLLLENERLQAEQRAQLTELRASRARIVRYADEERRRLERDLHDGAQQRLLGLGMGLQLIRARVEEGSEVGVLVDEVEAELGRALKELRELARGIHPAILTEQGLASAVRALAERTPVPVRVVVPDQPLPRTVEAAAYFVVAESLANVAKYADARRAWVTVANDNGAAHVEVRDDGVGGAQPADGSGLQGLADRVGALGGRLRIDSPPGGGTRISAILPCA